MRAFVLFVFAFFPVVVSAQTPQESFVASVEKLALDQPQISLGDIEAKARAAFERHPDEIRKTVDAWLKSLPPHVPRNDFLLVAEYGKTGSIEAVDAALKERPTAARLFMQAVTPQDLVWLALSQVESLQLRRARQSFQIARLYVKPRVELISRSNTEVRLAIFDFDSLIELTAVPSSAGVLCPCAYRILEKGTNKSDPEVVPTTAPAAPMTPAP